MAITPDVMTITVDGITIGLSDTIGDLITAGDFTVENLAAYMICGQTNKLCPIFISITGEESTYGTASAANLPLYFPNINTGSLGPDTVEFAQNDNPSLPHDMYGRNILVYGSLGAGQVSIDSSMTTSQLRVVTSIDFKKIYYDVDMSSASVSATRPDSKTFTYYQTGSGGAVKTADNDVDTGINVFAVVSDGIDPEWYCIIDDMFPKSDTASVPWLRTSGQYISGPYNSTYAALYNGWSSFDVTKKLWRWAKPAAYDIYGGDGSNWTQPFNGYIDNGDDHYSYMVYSPYGATMTCVPDGLEYALLQIANAGLKFKYNNNWYKPIGEGGFITGYTDDMAEVSEWDDIEDVTGNDVPSAPPSPGPSPDVNDKVDDMTISSLLSLSSDAGFAAYFLLTSSQLASLHTWLTTTAFPDGYDPYQYIISLMQFPMKLTPNWCLSGTAGSIHIGGEDTGISASLIGTEQVWHGIGTFDVPRINGNFLDYEPYSQYEVYIPCCGWVTVPDIVAGHTINIRINYDLTDGTIIGNVYVSIKGDWLLIASKSGMMGRQTVISGEAQGVKSAQVTSALLNAGTGALNVATGIMSGNAVAAVSGGYNIVAGLAQANIASNSSYARQIGSTGGRSLLCQYDRGYVKITTTEVYIPENYGHTVGYICNRKGKVSDFKGFTIFQNVDTSGIAGATEREREAIKHYLESGIIINSAPSP